MFLIVVFANVYFLGASHWSSFCETSMDSGKSPKWTENNGGAWLGTWMVPVASHSLTPRMSGELIERLQVLAKLIKYQ